MKRKEKAEGKCTLSALFIQSKYSSLAMFPDGIYRSALWYRDGHSLISLIMDLGECAPGWYRSFPSRQGVAGHFPPMIMVMHGSGSSAFVFSACCSWARCEV